MDGIKIFQVPATIEKIETMGHGLRLKIDTQETVTADDAHRLFAMLNKIGWFSFNVHQIEAEDIVDLPPLVKQDKKTKSQQLRAVIFRLWEQDKKGMEFDAYYDAAMDKLIDHYKGKLA